MADTDRIDRFTAFTKLPRAFAHYGRIFKTLHLLQVVHVEDYRRMIGA